MKHGTPGLLLEDRAKTGCDIIDLLFDVIYSLMSNGWLSNEWESFTAFGIYQSDVHHFQDVI